MGTQGRVLVVGAAAALAVAAGVIGVAVSGAGASGEGPSTKEKRQSVFSEVRGRGAADGALLRDQAMRQGASAVAAPPDDRQCRAEWRRQLLAETYGDDEDVMLEYVAGCATVKVELAP
ncbi:hypothetical protein [Streptomyces sp. NPDC088925]|uniref:hypothetical protein n=1 Tax=Streptomyces sp. NPDC088925 TaxID=3365914 RepID=UPI00380F5C01